MPDTTAGRIAALDVLRGLAILGTFGTNVWIFAHPGGPAGFLVSGFADAGIVGTALGAVSNGKFLALLTLLFGVGLELQHRSAVRRGAQRPRRADLGGRDRAGYVAVRDRADRPVGDRVVPARLTATAGRRVRHHRVGRPDPGPADGARVRRRSTAQRADGVRRVELVSRRSLPATPLVALGLLALVTEVVLRTRREPGPVRRGLTAAGRTSLSCYVLQNVVASVLCYGWGFGLAARFADARPWWVIGLWFGVCALFMILADRWLRYVDRGPLEILVHRLQTTRRQLVAAVRATEP